MTERNADLVLGTAGHIDHGKSTLVLALTGTDPDRLAEEKERGITITLGFARLELDDGVAMGVVDVPGHERFVRQMIAGATGIDVALLVVAADDGVMPQTREHVAVLQTLGVAHCVVALTKTDLVDVDWVEFMADEVREWLGGGPYAGAPVVPVSAKTGESLPELRAALLDACRGAEHGKTGAQVRMPVDRVFTVKGAGTVVTGTLWSGSPAIDDVLEVMPGGKQVRVRSIQTHGKALERAVAGNRVALNLGGVSTGEVRPGDFLASVGLLEETDRFDARLTYLDTAGTGKPLESGVRMHVAHGTREVLGRVLLADGQERLLPGESARVQVRLEEPLPVSAQDRFVVRTYSPVAVAGGGTVLLAHPRRRTNLSEEERELLGAVEGDDLLSAVEHAVKARHVPVTAQEVARMVGVELAAVEERLAEVVRMRRVVALPAAGGNPGLFAAQALCGRVSSAIERVLVGHHADNPTSAGLPKGQLAQHCAPHMEPWRFDALLAHAAAAGKAVVVGSNVGHPSSLDAVRVAEDEATGQLLEEMRRCGTSPPPTKYLLQQSGLEDGMARRALSILRERGDAVQVADDIWMDAATLEECRAAVRTALADGAAATAAQLKEAMGTSRKYAMPLLELFDKEGLTVREGDLRKLRE